MNDDLNQRAQKIVASWRDLIDFPPIDSHDEERMASNIAFAFAQVRDEQKEIDARKCDEIAAKYTRGTFNDSSREVRAAEDCAKAIREEK